MTFPEAVRKIHPEITGQSASELGELLVTAQKRQQSDSETLSMGLQTLKKEVLDEGYDWSDLITNLIDLLCADFQEDHHKQFVLELDRLYASNASLSEVGSVIASDYRSALERLQVLIQEAQKDHEELGGMAGGTSNHVFKTWKPNANRTKKQKVEAIGLDVLEAGTVIGAVSFVGYKLNERAKLAKSIEDYSKEVEKTAGRISERNVGKENMLWDDIESTQEVFKEACKQFDFKSYARGLGNVMSDKVREAEKLIDAKDKGGWLTQEEAKLTNHRNRFDHNDNYNTRQNDIYKVANNPEFTDYYEDQRAIRVFNEYQESGRSLDEFIQSKKASKHIRKEYVKQDVEQLKEADINPRRLEREAEREAGELDLSDNPLFNRANEYRVDRNKNDRPDRKDEIDKALQDPTQAAERIGEAGEKEIKDGEIDAEQEIRKGEIAAEQEVRADEKLVEAEVKADVDGAIRAEGEAITDLEQDIIE